MTFFKTVAIAFSMFSSVPMPRVEWNKKNMKYMMCAFPLVGLLIFVLYLAWGWAILRLKISAPVAALGCTLIPVLISGGIHVDGFCDTCDALASHADREKKLEILKDSNSGAFAVFGCVVYFLSYYVLCLSVVSSMGALWPVRPFYPGLFFAAGKSYVGMAFVFILERFLSAFAVAVFPVAKNSGLVHAFADSSAKKFTSVFCFFGVASVSFCIVFFTGEKGIAALVAVYAFFLYYYVMSKKEFGGITGDVAGWFVQCCEIISLAAFVFAGRFL